MARTTKQAQIDELTARCAALEARLELARDVYRNQKARIAELEAALNTRGVKPTVGEVLSRALSKPAEVRTTFTRRDGTVCERIRVGNRAVVRVVPRTTNEVQGMEVVYQ